ncbi:hypothetical protein ZOSMA_355G00070 [Zostera marina]|uniref:Uncharacterized protein n=1 Tax=Zostera marina TaxID=29655 RepID=A0A0K9P6M8_ZOSMR|nr:hypothetical protein ZOSMA_355G00070 [Zostera marina]
MVMNSVRSLKSAEESLREQVERGKKKEAAFIVAFAKKDKEISDLKYVVLDLQVQLKPAAIQARRLLSDPTMHQEYLRLKLHELEMKLALEKSEYAEFQRKQK